MMILGHLVHIEGENNDVYCDISWDNNRYYDTYVYNERYYDSNGNLNRIVIVMMITILIVWVIMRGIGRAMVIMIYSVIVLLIILGILLLL